MIETAMDGLLLNMDFEIKPRIMIFMIFLGLTTTVNLFKASFESSISPTPDTKETATQASRTFFKINCTLCIVRHPNFRPFAENLCGKVEH